MSVEGVPSSVWVTVEGMVLCENEAALLTRVREGIAVSLAAPPRSLRSLCHRELVISPRALNA